MSQSKASSQLMPSKMHVHVVFLAFLQSRSRDHLKSFFDTGGFFRAGLKVLDRLIKKASVKANASATKYTSAAYE